jgi:hypothetical protein
MCLAKILCKFCYSYVGGVILCKFFVTCRALGGQCGFFFASHILLESYVATKVRFIC